MYLEHFHLTRQPFLDEADPTLFFADTGRGEILRSMLKDLKSGKPLIKLIGGEGAGKTLLCKLMAAQLPDRYETVFITNPLGSFEELLRIISLDLGITPTAGSDSEEISEQFKEYILQKKEEGGFVFIIIDEAEKLFLATLERLIRMICELEPEDTVRILLSGRPGLETNIEQLGNYSIKVDLNSGYILSPLTSEETQQYLNFRLRACGMPDSEQLIFSAEAAAGIYETAKGNLRLTNILAEEALQRSCSEKSFLVLLEHVESQTPERGDDEPASRHHFPVIEVARRMKAWLAAAGSIFLVFLIIILNADDKKRDDSAPPEQTTQFDQQMGHELMEEALEQQPAVDSQESTVDSPAPAVATTGEENTPIEIGEEAAGPVEPLTTADAVAPGADETTETVDSPATTETAGAETVTPDVAREEKIEQAGATAQAGKRSGEVIYNERLRAGETRLPEVASGYTIQVMALGSQQAASNLQKILVKDDYYNIREQIYILKKNITPPTIFVFHGTYASMDEARNARNTMPLFLREHHPYALPVADALRKSGRQR